MTTLRKTGGPIGNMEMKQRHFHVSPRYVRRKIIYSFCSRSALILFLSLFLAYPGSGNAAAVNKKKKIVFIHYNLKSDSTRSTIIDKFKEAMELRGYRDGENIEYVDITTQSNDRDAVAEILTATDNHKDNTDMFVTSSWTSLYVRSKLAGSGVPQLFVPALKSTALNMLPSVTRETGTNLSGVYLMYPPEKILRLTRLIFPTLRNYAYIYDSRIPADLIFKAAFTKLSDAERHGITLHYLDLAAGDDVVLGKMKELRIEAYGGVVGAFIHGDTLERSNLPVVTLLMIDRDEESVRQYVRGSNIVAGLFNPLDYCGEQAAEMTADIFDGKRTIETTVPRPAKQLSFANMISAERFKVTIPFSALEAVDIVIK